MIENLSLLCASSWVLNGVNLTILDVYCIRTYILFYFRVDGSVFEHWWTLLAKPLRILTLLPFSYAQRTNITYESLIMCMLF